ncbi:MAG: calcium-binding protein [Pseudomonadota bacterium]
MRFTKAVDRAGFEALRGTEAGEVTTLREPTTYRALAGDDIVTGSRANDRIFGGRGNDTLYGDGLFGSGQGGDRLFGQAGNDQLFGRFGADRLVGGAGNDQIAGGDGSDKLFGGGGDDFLYDGQGRDQLSGGRGRDVFHVSEISGRGNRIKDFEDGTDFLFIDFEGVGFDDLRIKRKGGGTEVSVIGENDRFLLEGIRRGQIDQADVRFIDEFD